MIVTVTAFCLLHRGSPSNRALSMDHCSIFLLDRRQLKTPAPFRVDKSLLCHSAAFKAALISLK
jgi:hypothetical protein